MKYGRLTIIGEERRSIDYHECICDCGKTTSVKLTCLRTGNTKSCGCIRRDIVSLRFRKHYGKGTPEYTSWQLMKDRCYNQNNKTFSYYGGKGVRVDDKWIDDFTVFLSDMGKKPGKSHTLDRVNGDLNYSKENCRWATKTEQVRNRKNTKFIEYKGERKPLAEWCEILNLDYNNTNKRIWRGWEIERAFTERKKNV